VFNVRIDDDGNLRCWNCGGKSFNRKRSFKGKVAMGLLAGKKLKCDVCGQNNDPGKAQPYTGPAGRKYRKAEKKRAGAAPARPAAPPPAPAPQGPPAGWYPDPRGQAAQRWWDGTTWTDHTQA
jgi:hypothetical protein